MDLIDVSCLKTETMGKEMVRIVSAAVIPDVL
jgi:hypothetical protein